ncbi:MAG: MFS transporter [Pseudomonadota bacterium]
MQRAQIRFLFLNVGHFLDHYFMLIFATVAALRLSEEWGLSYAELIPYATPGFIAFGVCAIPAGWLADKWSREGMIAIFFVGIGISSMLSGFANTPLQIALGLAAIGVFAAIYHPVGLSMVVHGRTKTGVPLAINGIFGNMGVAGAALITGYLIDATDWRSAFYLSGALSVIIGVMYIVFLRADKPDQENASASSKAQSANAASSLSKQLLVRVFAVIFFTTAIGGLIFQSTTFALPKVFDERLAELAGNATLVGWYTFLVFAIAAFGQLVVGYMVDRFSVRIVFACVALSQAIFLALMVSLDGIAALLVSVAFMLAVFGQIPINDVLVGRIAKSEWRSRAYALRYIITFSVMASAIPVIAWLHGTWGFNVLFIVLAAAAMLIFSATLMLPTVEQRTAEPANATS